MNAELQFVGHRVPQLEGHDKVLGAALYTHDMVLPGMLHCAIVRSPHAHARILAIDTREALKVAGVVNAITSNDFAGEKYVNFGPAYADRYALSRDVVRFIGEEVAAVAAETLEAALAGAMAVKVDYAPLPAVPTVAQALQAGAVEVHPPKPGLLPNVAQDVDVVFGDVERALAQAHLVVRGSFEHGIVWPVCMETNAALAAYDPAQGVLEVWAGTQAPYFVRKELAQVLGIDAASIKVRPVTIGGGFGGKSQSPEQIAIAAMLSIKTGRPVKVVLSRQEEYLAGKTDHGKSMTLCTAVDREGNVLARTVEALVDNGAYTHMGPVYVSAVRQRTTSLYRVASAAMKARLVYTNKVPGGSYRGMGAPGAIWAIETQIDEIAERLGIDPVQYRLKIANRPGDETPLGWRITSCGLAECIERAAELIGWRDKKGKLPPMRGIGIASMIHPSGSVLYAEGNYSNVSIDLQPDGRLLVGTQSADAGTGQNTVLAQFVAQTLGIPLDRISVLHMDTERNPDDLGSAASRVTFVTGNAAIDAAKNLTTALIQQLSRTWGVEASEVSYAEGRFRLQGVPGHNITLEEAALEYGPMRVEGHYAIDIARPDPKTGFGNYAVAYAFGAQAVEVAVDQETGHVKVLRVTSVQDVGKVVNPIALEGQTYGGIVQGIGMALSEEVVFEEGRPVNMSLFNYRVGRIVETPEIIVEFVETNDALGPFGAKAAGEPTINATVAAVANAVADAVGVRFMRLPITPERVLEALAEKRGNAAPRLKSYKRPYNAEIATVRALYPRVIFPALKALGRSFGRQRVRVFDFEVARAESDMQAGVMLAEQEAGNRVLGGGTDLLPGIRQGVYGPKKLIDCSGLPGMRELAADERRINIGAAVLLATLERSEALHALLPGLCEGVSQIATRQVRNRATAAGDLCQEKRCWFFRTATPCYRFSGPSCPCYAILGDNRHHAILGAGRCAAPCVSDLAPMLTALEALVVTTGAHAARSIPVGELYRWAGETVLAPGEFIASIEVPLEQGASFHYAKYARWRGDFAEASAAVKLTGSRRRLTKARIALGGVAPGPHVAARAQTLLAGGELNSNRVRAAAEAVVEGALPLTGNHYKAQLAVGQARRAIESAIEFLPPT